MPLPLADACEKKPTTHITWVEVLKYDWLWMRSCGRGYRLPPDAAVELEVIMNELKVVFVDAASAFNQLKGSSLGRVKIYGIANTHADFMLFRNGFKLIFSLKEPGAVSVRFHYVGAGFQGAGASVAPGTGAVASTMGEEDLLIARWGAFGDLNWTYQEQAIKIDYLVRYYMTRFVRESAK